jgi:hypothetical protein
MTNVIETNSVIDLDPFHYSPSRIPRIIKSYVDGLFKEDLSCRKGNLRVNPVHGGKFIDGMDPIATQKRDARRALLAREWFYEFGPRGAPPLPISSCQIEDMRYGFGRFGAKVGFYHLIAHFAASLRARGWDYTMHPSFGDFASSMLASDYVQHLDFLKNDEELHKRYPPRALYTIGPSGVWEPAKGERQSKHFARRK